MTMCSKNVCGKIVAAALGLVIVGGAVSDASAAARITKTGAVTKTHIAPATRTVKIVRGLHRAHRPLILGSRVLPGHRITPRVHLAKVFATKKIVKTTVVR